MKIKDLGPFAVFRFQGRVFVKSGGMIQRLDRSGTLFDPGPRVSWPDVTEVEPLDLAAPRDGQNCPVCFGGGYEPGEWNYDGDSWIRKRCPNGCLVEGLPDPVVEKPAGPRKCECCNQPVLDCEREAAPVESTNQ